MRKMLDSAEPVAGLDHEPNSLTPCHKESEPVGHGGRTTVVLILLTKPR